MKTITAILISLMFVLASSCDKSVESVPSNAYQYKAYDTTGYLIVQGWMTIVVHDSTNIDGEWHFTKVDDPQNIGPHFGDGTFHGAFDHGNLSLNLNPEFVDNNIMLQGRFASKSFSGKWFWIGLPGGLNHGGFEAIGN